MSNYKKNSTKYSLKEIFIVTLKVGALLIGGGYVMLPLLQKEFRDKRGWLTNEEILDYFSIASCAPGIIAINVIMLAGYKIKGKLGALTALVGLTCAPFLIIVSLSTVLSKLLSYSAIQGLFWGVNVSIILLVFLAIKELWSHSIKDKGTFFIFLTILALCFLKVSPSTIIIFSLILGYILSLIEKKAVK